MARARSLETYPGQRNKEKGKLFGMFPFGVLERHYKDKFYALFDSKCFKCGLPERLATMGGPRRLCMDHHVPMALGGELVAGNIVALCRRCNEAKWDRPPEDFYTEEELARLEPFLVAQHAFFQFTFDDRAWRTDPAGYLCSHGLDADVVNRVLHDPLDLDYIGLPEPAMNFSIGVEVDIDVLLGRKHEG